MIQAWIYKIILHKYTPIRWIAEFWDRAEGWRTAMAGVGWFVVYEMGRLHLWIFADPALTQKVLEGLGGVAGAMFLEKMKRNIGYADMTVDQVKQMLDDSKKAEETK